MRHIKPYLSSFFKEHSGEQPEFTFETSINFEDVTVSYTYNHGYSGNRYGYRPTPNESENVDLISVIDIDGKDILDQLSYGDIQDLEREALKDYRSQMEDKKVDASDFFTEASVKKLDSRLDKILDMLGNLYSDLKDSEIDKSDELLREIRTKLRELNFRVDKIRQAVE